MRLKAPLVLSAVVLALVLALALALRERWLV
jgi:hypothetical protein